MTQATTTTLTMDNLKKCFSRAWDNNANYIGIAVSIPFSSAEEVIINPAGNFAKKLAYYTEAYDDDLQLIKAPGIRITGFTYGDSYAEIEKKLFG